MNWREARNPTLKSAIIITFSEPRRSGLGLPPIHYDKLYTCREEDRLKLGCHYLIGYA